MEDGCVKVVYGNLWQHLEQYARLLRAVAYELEQAQNCATVYYGNSCENLKRAYELASSVLIRLLIDVKDLIEDLPEEG